LSVSADQIASRPAQGRLWASVRRWWPLLIALVVAASLAAFLYSSMVLARDPVFRAAATLDISPSRSEIDYANNFARGSALQSAAVLTQTYAEYAMSRPVMASVIDEYLARVPSARATPPNKQGLRALWNSLNVGGVPQQDRREALIDGLIESTTVGTVNGTYLLRVETAWDDRVAAAWFANEITDRLIAAAAVKSERPGEQLNQQLTQRLAQTRRQLEAKQAQAVAARQALGIADIPAQKQAIIEEKLAEEARLTNELALISSSAAQVGVLQRQANGKLSASLPAIDQALALERPRLAGLRQGATQRQARVAGLNDQLQRVSRAEATISILDRDIAILQADATALAERLSQVQLDTIAVGPTIRIVERATPPLVRDSPKVMVNTAMGFVGGCALAGMVLLLAPASTRTTRTRTRREAEPAEPARRAYPAILKAPRSGERFTPEQSREIRERLGTWLAEPLMDPNRTLYLLAAGRDGDAAAVGNLLRAFLQSRGETVQALPASGGALSVPAPAGDEVRRLVLCGGLGQSGEIPAAAAGAGDIILVVRDSSGATEQLQQELRDNGWRDPYLIRIEP
jgi:uncharacterized protein involved in exopolysaccharide biosynthesis